MECTVTKNSILKYSCELLVLPFLVSFKYLVSLVTVSLDSYYNTKHNNLKNIEYLLSLFSER